MSKPANILILGDGAMANALATLLRPRHRVRMWARNLKTWEENFPVEDAVPESDFVIFALPANPHAELADRIAPGLSGDSICLSIAKGLDDEGRLPIEVFRELIGSKAASGVIYGPMIANEITRGRRAFARVALAEGDRVGSVAGLFADSNLTVKATDDVIGLSWSVILKNVYVPMISAADALGLGDNVRGYLVANVAAEIDRIATDMGGKPGTAFSDAALGDLITTATSTESHHHQIGQDLVAGIRDRIAAEGVNIRGEGIHTLAMVSRHRRFDPQRYPLFSAIRDMVQDPGTIEDRFDRLFREGLGD